MIRLTKLPSPPILRSNSSSWSADYLQELSEGRKPYIKQKYAHKEIRGALRRETNGKCAYCESLIEAITYAHVEHILPKTNRPDLAFVWENLTLACPRCNVNKGTYYSEQAPLLDPYIDNIDEHLRFVGPMVLEKNQARGKLTKNRLRLNRDDLINARRMAIDNLNDLILAYQSVSDPSAKGVLLSQIYSMADPENQYSATLKAFIEGSQLE